MSSEKHHKSILLTNPDGFQSHLFEPTTSDTNDVANIEHIVPADEPEPISPEGRRGGSVDGTSGKGVQFDSEQLERGRSRIMKRDIAVRNDSSGSRSNSKSVGSMSRSRSRSRSMSRSRSRIREEEFLKWTVLRQDPSMRLYNVKRKNIKKKNVADEDEDEEEGEGHSDDSEDEDEDEEDEDEEEEEESDEEQVSDIEDDAEIDSKFDYDPGMKVLPNFVVSINDVLESKKPWISKFVSDGGDSKIEEGIKFDKIDEGYVRGLKLLTKRLKVEGPIAETISKKDDNDTTESTGNCYILYVDMSSESMYALTYMMGTIVNNGDTLYIVHWESSSKNVSEETIRQNIVKLGEHCYHLFDCISGVVDTLDVIILSLTHPYPKHLLNEMISTLKPQTLCCSLSMILSGLQNFVCGVPTLVIRKKLKRTKKKGIME
ncbi:similar to Saccharomyces cerevisiae YIL154C IMP2' Transcriptional activator involved in maintenance of ion homeostasis and protection against DNA damage caused by bleomycin and other oxidants [Maudiozyma saulgeensis]|uniref:Similar to Saccharomyces cerevisiae YIL154C IMP2' Transcriptional activator involved in maintenance of ion homeostasis and protection against DNA damage caused by bleomycin and other oxidants n=1 Tax=Maudiozyma saulgeensis TaxID=1789683 RepID=A0A1X7QY18_9SACH|nr:similar to Saccharomyces cerevisiae YIL154C IMP2' Transcriptional activator involved in maintenance of ion homeostasis and protection against DNA damage caused by bleomycin and other oxidants [Kazachstania saulgeensis]